MEQRIKEVMSKVFGLNIAAINEDSSPDTIDAWDSINHMTLILSLEQEFGIEFNDDVLDNTLDFRSILNYLSKH
ncbi:acyl carrier protein [Paenibacillus radicis (ex Xue et al. 2023)]|uniref:Acyl carrier protein n=1 Tax=Paenibacillus radicis (ex Xue et al. 2023) TaxID=2972489 RepID=A0ABT1YGR0_9BACL|nr:acyl carrier protein [Paenibacillus radicis (ex Xue et al. 2023)]MCR8632381.1 acyl carrier protein [Paenibacillus radicis (ex Xue et al. 2023)]